MEVKRAGRLPTGYRGGKKLAGYWIYGFISAAPPLFETLKSVAFDVREGMFRTFVFYNNVVTIETWRELAKSILLKNTKINFFIIVKTFSSFLKCFCDFLNRNLNVRVKETARSPTLAHFVEFNGMYGYSLDSFLFQAKYCNLYILVLAEHGVISARYTRKYT